MSVRVICGVCGVLGDLWSVRVICVRVRLM